jgi:hypothetical protein
MGLDQAFNAGTLSELRKIVLAAAIRAGMPAEATRVAPTCSSGP